MKAFAVVGGTPGDTALGCDLLRKGGHVACGFPVSESVEAQNDLQNSDIKKIEEVVLRVVAKLDPSTWKAMVIFCNSLSLCVDLNELRRRSLVPILSPVELYGSLVGQCRKPFVFAANRWTFERIGRIIMGEGREGDGYYDSRMIDCIERGLDAELVSREFGLMEMLSRVERAGSDALVLGCTHLHCIKGIFEGRVSVPIFDSGEELIRSVAVFPESYFCSLR